MKSDNKVGRPKKGEESSQLNTLKKTREAVADQTGKSFDTLKKRMVNNLHQAKKLKIV